MVSLSQIYQLYTALYAYGWGRYYDSDLHDGIRAADLQQQQQQQAPDEPSSQNLRQHTSLKSSLSLEDDVKSRADGRAEVEKELAMQLGVGNVNTPHNSSELRTLFGGLGSM